ncbi:MAG: hypothetical protein EA339_04005 [Rhodobacteraceae bacterium]|nr:MAG: hypothetical protein EA339_04005 [Paracoccaceae bacterium]
MPYILFSVSFPAEGLDVHGLSCRAGETPVVAESAGHLVFTRHHRAPCEYPASQALNVSASCFAPLRRKHSAARTLCSGMET